MPRYASFTEKYGALFATRSYVHCMEGAQFLNWECMENEGHYLKKNS